MLLKSAKSRVAVSARKGPDLRRLQYHPEANPLMAGCEVELRRRFVSTGVHKDLHDSDGEVTHAAVIKEVVEIDDSEFVKVFAAGVRATHDLSRTAWRVFQLVLEAYQAEPMRGGFADSIYLAWFDGGLNGQTIGMSEDTFQRGMKELLAKGFLAPRTPNLFWVNPALFFKGDRALFVKEYRRRRRADDEILQQQSSQAQLEAQGQQRIPGVDLDTEDVPY